MPIKDFCQADRSIGSDEYKPRQWTKFSKLQDNCPICEGKHTRCTTNGHMVICGEDFQIPGWRNIRQDSVGIGYRYIPDSSQLSTWKKLPKLPAAKLSRSSRLTQGEINNKLTEVLCQETVSEFAEADLLRRGVIPKGLLGKSFPKGTVSSLYQTLPGIYWDAMNNPRFNTPKQGNYYFCPAFNEDGLVIGGQLKTKDGKYIWLSGGSKGGVNHHINGRSPHTLCNFNEKKQVKFVARGRKDSKPRSNVILFAEGVLKPYVINQLSGYPCIGAVGGNFAGNFDDIDRFIKKLTGGKHKQFTFAIAADAGSGINDLVVDKYKKLVDYIKDKYDKEVYIVWYGQYTKIGNDFDEDLLLEKGKYKLISFFSFVSQNQKFKFLNDRKILSCKNIFTERYLPVSNYFWGNIKNPIIELARKVNNGERHLLAIKSPVGTGKTEAIKKLLSELNNGIFLIGYRNSLLMQTGERIKDIYHQSQIVNRLHFHVSQESISLCVDSIWKIQIEDVKEKVLVLDEAPLVLNHLLMSETCKSRRGELWRHFKNLCENCAGILIMSDQLSDMEVEQMQLLSNISDVMTVENQYKLPSRTVVSYEDENEFKEVLDEVICNKKKVLIKADSKQFIEAWNRRIKECNDGCRTLVVNSDTLYLPEVQAFLKNPDNYLENYDVVMLSPTTESGLSIDRTGYFDFLFIRWSHLGLDNCIQIMHRLRDSNCPIHLFAYEAIDRDKTFEDLILKEENKLDDIYSELKTNRISQIMSTSYNLDLIKTRREVLIDAEKMYSYYSGYYQSIEQIRLYERHSFRDLLVHELTTRGYEVRVYLDGEAEGINLSEYHEEIKDEKAEAILNARNIDDNDYNKLSLSEVKTPQQVAELRRYNLKQKLPDIDTTEHWNHYFIKDVALNNPNKLDKLWRRYLYYSPELSALLKDKAVINAVKHGFCVPDWNLNYAVIKDLKKLPLDALRGRSFSKNSDNLKQFILSAKKCRFLPNKKKLDHIRWLNKILDFIGLKAVFKDQKRISGSRVREYEIVDTLTYTVADIEEKTTKDILLYPALNNSLNSKKDRLYEKYNKKYFTDLIQELFLGDN